MQWLSGYKTIAGALGLLAAALSEADVVVLMPDRWRPYVIGASAMLTALGVTHKVEKRRRVSRFTKARRS